MWARVDLTDACQPFIECLSNSPLGRTAAARQNSPAPYQFSANLTANRCNATQEVNSVNQQVWFPARVTHSKTQIFSGLPPFATSNTAEPWDLKPVISYNPPSRDGSQFLRRPGKHHSAGKQMRAGLRGQYY